MVKGIYEVVFGSFSSLCTEVSITCTFQQKSSIITIFGVYTIQYFYQKRENCQIYTKIPLAHCSTVFG